MSNSPKLISVLMKGIPSLMNECTGTQQSKLILVTAGGIITGFPTESYPEEITTFAKEAFKLADSEGIELEDLDSDELIPLKDVTVTSGNQSYHTPWLIVSRKQIIGFCFGEIMPNK